MKSCPHCGSEFLPRKPRQKYCSRPCVWSNNGGQNRKPETWWLNQKGYIEGRVWVGSIQRRMKQHRWVVEQHLGRELFPTEDVHHLNGNRTDNRIENLLLIDHGAHTSLTNRQREYKTGYVLNLSDAERERRSRWAKEMNLSDLGRAAIARTEPTQ